jgi:hypothetical protein
MYTTPEQDARREVRTRVPCKCLLQYEALMKSALEQQGRNESYDKLMKLAAYGCHLCDGEMWLEEWRAINE